MAGGHWVISRHISRPGGRRERAPAMKYAETSPRSHWRHPPRQAEPDDRFPCRDRARQARELQPRGLRQGPDGLEHGPPGGGGGPARSRRHAGREHVGQHRPRSRDGRGGARIPLRVHDAGQDEQGEDRHAQGVRRGGHHHPHRSAARPSRELRGGRQTHRGGDPRRLLHRSVLQHAQPRGPLPDHRPGDLGADRRPARRLRGRESAPAARSRGRRNT